jgi:cyclic-di-AMP phosphodiesterase PgpH
MKINTLKTLLGSRKRSRQSKIEDSPAGFNFFKRLAESENIKIALWALLALIMAVLITPRLIVPAYTYQLDDVALHAVYAPRDFSVEDHKATEIRREDRLQAVRSVYDFNSRADREVEERITRAFASLRDLLAREDTGDDLKTLARTLCQDQLKIQIDDPDFNLLFAREFKKDIEDYLLDLVMPFAQREIVPSKAPLFKERGRGIVLRNIYTQDEIILDDFSPLIDLKEAELLVRREARQQLRNVRADVSRTIVNLALKLIAPTITPNSLETATRRSAALQSVSPLYYNVKKGETIVQAGDKINEAALVKLQALTNMQDRRSMLRNLIGNFMLSLFALYALYRFSTAARVRGLPGLPSARDLCFICITLIITFIVIKICIALIRGLEQGSLAIEPEIYLYGLPFAFAAIVISVVLSPRIATLSSVIVAMFVCMALDNRFSFFMYSFLGSIIAAQEVSHTRERKNIIRAGLVAGGANVLVIIALSLINDTIFNAGTALCMGLGVLSGVLAAVLAIGIIPIIEMTFNYTTDIKLLELADLNQPVLRQLLINAPGTYHHSILVGILSEAAAESVQANPLLARVSSYYHDIGKIKKAQYFVENQSGGENRHDKLQPSMSSLIIAKHVRDGVDLARQYRLGKPIIDIIMQHHGTSCMTFFYQKARDMSDGEQPVSDKNFRYPGPKPQTKEAGIVMLADAVEATSKTLTEPTAARIQGMVQRIINNIFVDGQLDECELTLKDLHLIALSFNRILTGIFHSRIDYPVKPEKETNGKGSDKKPAKDADRPGTAQTDGEPDLGKRIGISKARGKYPAA